MKYQQADKPAAGRANPPDEPSGRAAHPEDSPYPSSIAIWLALARNLRTLPDVSPSMNRTLLVILAALTLGSAGFGIAQLGEVQKLKDSLSELDIERLALQKRLWDLQKRNNELLNRSRTTRTASTSDATADSADGPGGPNAGAPRTGRWDRGAGGEFGRFNALLANPAVQKLMAVQQKGGLDGRYASLFKSLQLSPADLDKFKNLLVEKQASVMDVMAAARAQGLDPRDNRDQVRQLVQDAQNDVDANIHATLGDAAYAQYQNFESTLPQRNTVNQLSQRLSYSADPLTDSQSQQLVQIMADSSTPGGNTSVRATGAAVRALVGGGGGPGGLGGTTPITDDTINRAQSVLSTQQLTALQALQQEQQASAQLMQQMRRPGPTTTVAGDAATPPRS
jgi:hypothetical protein